MKRVLFVLLVVLSALIFSEQQSPIYAANAGTQDKTPVPTMRQGASRAVGAGYVIGRGDLLAVTVWRQPMLSGAVLVRSDGMITVGLVGDVKAAGLTPMALKNVIQQRLKEFVEAPEVSVAVRTPASQKFFIIGEVKTPGEYDLVRNMSVVQGIARAGGFTEWASKGNIVLLRKENGVEKRIKVNYKNIINGNDFSDPGLKANDTIIVR